MSFFVCSLIFLLIPLLYSFRIYRFFLKSRDEEKNSRENNKLIYKFISLVPVSLFVMFVICIYSGYFRFWVVAIASGSMEKQISKGDIVIVEKIEEDYSKLKEKARENIYPE